MSTRFEVIHGDPSDEELAVVVSLLTAAASSAGGTQAPRPQQSPWSRPALRVTMPAGPGAWWQSGLPRP